MCHYSVVKRVGYLQSKVIIFKGDMNFRICSYHENNENEISLKTKEDWNLHQVHECFATKYIVIKNF